MLKQGWPVIFINSSIRARDFNRLFTRELKFMAAISLAKSKIKIVLLEGVHPSAADMLRREGYTNVVSHPKYLSGDALAEALKGAYFAGIRSATQLTADVLNRTHRLIGIGCFCIGTNQVDLESA